MPSTRTSLSRERSPRTIVTLEARTPSRSASSRRSASFARPSSGGAATRTTKAPSRRPTTWLPRARACTRTAIFALAMPLREQDQPVRAEREEHRQQGPRDGPAERVLERRLPVAEEQHVHEDAEEQDPIEHDRHDGRRRQPDDWRDDQ